MATFKCPHCGARLEVIETFGLFKPMADRARWHLGDAADYPFPPETAPAVLPPWASTTTHISGHLTSPQFVKATALDALMLGASCAVLGGGVTLLFQLPWYLVPMAGLGGGAISAAILIVFNRWELHRMVKGQVDKGKPRRQELTVTVLPHDDTAHPWKILYDKTGITIDQLREFGKAVYAGKPLKVHLWTPESVLFKRTQYDNLMAEMMQAGYVRDGSGNQPRCLTAKGRAFVRGLAET